jgi:hypothetical protein
MLMSSSNDGTAIWVGFFAHTPLNNLVNFIVSGQLEGKVSLI